MADGNPQERAAWLASRVGHVTASHLHKVVRRTAKGEPYAAYHDYQAEIVLERLTGRAMDRFTTPAMERGLMLEPAAVLAYEMEMGVETAFSDFVRHGAIEWYGASPDRLVDKDGLLEAKCPGVRAHFDFIMSGTAPVEYYWQCQAQMDCTGREWADLFFYHPDMPAHLMTRRLRIMRNQQDIDIAHECVAQFNSEVEQKLERLRDAA